MILPAWAEATTPRRSCFPTRRSADTPEGSEHGRRPFGGASHSEVFIELEGDQLARFGLTPDDVNRFVETAMHGKVISEVLQGRRTFDLLVRLDEQYREDLAALKRMSLDLPEGGTTSLSSVARIYMAGRVVNGLRL